MLKTLLVGIFCLLLIRVTTHAQQTLETNENVQPNEQLNQMDTIGSLVRLGNSVLNQFIRNLPVDENKCTPTMSDVGGNTVVMAQQPRGYCSFCCSLTNASNYIRLRFTNKSKSGSTVLLEMGRKPGALQAAGVNKTLNTIIYIHGFTEYGLGVTSSLIRDAYLSVSEDYNIILVDWSDLSAGPWYLQAAENAKLSGNLLAKFLKFYNRTGELPISKIHVIGFSLGAQVSGFLGKYILKRTKQKLPRITGLDPAFPLFPLKDPSQRLSNSDANFVDVIHTDGGTLGFPISIGHADFYPNGGGAVQPGCEASKLVERNFIQNLPVCGHVRAVYFFAESVKNPSAFPVSKCAEMRNKSSGEKCRFVVDGYMGFSASKNTTLGDFYLTTNDRQPFARSAKEQEEKTNM